MPTDRRLPIHWGLPCFDGPGSIPPRQEIESKWHRRSLERSQVPRPHTAQLRRTPDRLPPDEPKHSTKKTKVRHPLLLPGGSPIEEEAPECPRLIRRHAPVRSNADLPDQARSPLCSPRLYPLPADPLCAKRVSFPEKSQPDPAFGCSTLLGSLAPCRLSIHQAVREDENPYKHPLAHDWDRWDNQSAGPDHVEPT